MGEGVRRAVERRPLSHGERAGVRGDPPVQSAKRAAGATIKRPNFRACRRLLKTGDIGGRGAHVCPVAGRVCGAVVGPRSGAGGARGACHRPERLSRRQTPETVGPAYPRQPRARRQKRGGAVRGRGVRSPLLRRQAARLLRSQPRGAAQGARPAQGARRRARTSRSSTSRATAWPRTKATSSPPSTPR